MPKTPYQGLIRYTGFLLRLLPRKAYELEHRDWVGSILLHGVIALLFVIFGKGYLNNVSTKNSLELEVLDAQQVKKYLAPDRQVVDTEKNNSKAVPVEKSFLSEQDQKVDKATKARVVKTFKKASSTASSSQGTHQSTTSEAFAKWAPKIDFGQAQMMDPAKKGLQAGQKLNQSLGEAYDAATRDYLENISEGAQTLLNTREYKYYSFYKRIRIQLEQYWEPGLRNRITKMIQRGRSLVEDSDLKTHLVVILDKLGRIQKIEVRDTSGVFDLDQAAIDAFNHAGPFPNPPEGVLSQDGTVAVEWQFVLRT